MSRPSGRASGENSPLEHGHFCLSQTPSHVLATHLHHLESTQHSLSQCQRLCMIPGCHYDDPRAHGGQFQKVQEISGLDFSHRETDFHRQERIIRQYIWRSLQKAATKWSAMRLTVTGTDVPTAATSWPSHITRVAIGIAQNARQRPPALARCAGREAPVDKICARVLTLPRELAPLTLQNKKVIFKLLFHASAETLLELAHERRASRESSKQHARRKLQERGGTL